MIEHLVISGGGPLFLNMYGAIKRAEEEKLWSKPDIKTFHGTSAGAILSLILALDYTWDILDNYIINRPWQNILSFDVLNIYTYYETNGILDITFIEEVFMPLFKGVGIEKNITFSEFEILTGKKLYFYTTQYNTFSVAELSSDATPHISILEAVYASCTLPILFKPRKINDIVYIDGCIFLDNPLAKAMEKGYAPETVLAITKKSRKLEETDVVGINIFEYIMCLMNSLFTKTQLICLDTTGITQIPISSTLSDLANFFNMAESATYRQTAINKGIADTEAFISAMKSEETPLNFPA